MLFLATVFNFQLLHLYSGVSSFNDIFDLREIGVTTTVRFSFYNFAFWKKEVHQTVTNIKLFEKISTITFQATSPIPTPRSPLPGPLAVNNYDPDDPPV